MRQQGQALGSYNWPVLNSESLVRSPAEFCYGRSIFFGKHLPREPWVTEVLEGGTEPAVKHQWSELILASYPGQSFKNTSVLANWSQNGSFGRGAEMGLRSAPFCKITGHAPKIGHTKLWKRWEGGGCHAICRFQG